MAHGMVMGLDFLSGGSHVKLSDARTPLRMLFGICVAYCKIRLPKKTPVLTSVIRSVGIHSHGRAIDWGFTHQEMKDEGVRRVLLDLKARINGAFPYEATDGRSLETFVYCSPPVGSGSDPTHEMHVHLQMPANGWGI